MDNCYPSRHGVLQLRLCHRSWEHCMAAKRIVPAVRSFAWLGSGNCNELGEQFHRWSDLSAHDAVSHSLLDVCNLRWRLRRWLAWRLENISRDHRVGIGRCAASAQRLIRRSGKLEKNEAFRTLTWDITEKAARLGLSLQLLGGSEATLPGIAGLLAYAGERFR